MKENLNSILNLTKVKEYVQYAISENKNKTNIDKVVNIFENTHNKLNDISKREIFNKMSSNTVLLDTINVINESIEQLEPFNWHDNVAAYIKGYSEILESYSNEILVESVIRELEYGTNSNYYKTAYEKLRNILDESKNIETEIVENFSNYSWIPEIRYLVENFKTQINYKNNINVNIDTVGIYSPVINENGRFIFNSNGLVLELNDGKLYESSYAGNSMFNKLTNIINSKDVKVNESSVKIYPSNESILEFNIKNDSIILNEKEIQKESLENTLLVGRHVKLYDNNKLADILFLSENYNNIKNIDIGFKINSKIYEGVSVSVFNIDNDIYIQKTNPYMSENRLYKYNTIRESVEAVKDFINVDISNNIKNIKEIEEDNEYKIKVKINSILDKIDFLQKQLDNVNNKQTQYNLANVGSIKEAKEFLQNEIESYKNEIKKLSL